MLKISSISVLAAAAARACLPQRQKDRRGQCKPAAQAPGDREPAAGSPYDLAAWPAMACVQDCCSEVATADTACP